VKDKFQNATRKFERDPFALVVDPCREVKRGRGRERSEAVMLDKEIEISVKHPGQRRATCFFVISMHTLSQASKPLHDSS